MKAPVAKNATMGSARLGQKARPQQEQEQQGRQVPEEPNEKSGFLTVAQTVRSLEQWRGSHERLKLQQGRKTVLNSWHGLLLVVSGQGHLLRGLPPEEEKRPASQDVSSASTGMSQATASHAKDIRGEDSGASASAAAGAVDDSAAAGMLQLPELSTDVPCFAVSNRVPPTEWEDDSSFTPSAEFLREHGLITLQLGIAASKWGTRGGTWNIIQRRANCIGRTWSISKSRRTCWQAVAGSSSQKASPFRNAATHALCAAATASGMMQCRTSRPRSTKRRWHGKRTPLPKGRQIPLSSRSRCGHRCSQEPREYRGRRLHGGRSVQIQMCRCRVCSCRRMQVHICHLT